MLKTRAQSSPSTTKPGTIAATSTTIKALITKLKSPKVTIFIGSVKSKIKGLIKVLTTARSTATIKAVTNPSTLTPGNIYALIKTANPLSIKLIKICKIFSSFNLLVVKLKPAKYPPKYCLYKAYATNLKCFQLRFFL